MSVLELSEESRSLRQAAKAWSNGDIPLADYRMIRRATLEGMMGIAEDDDDDDQPDSLTEPNDDTEVVDPVEITPRGRQKASLMLVVAAVIVAGALLLIFLA